MVKIRLSRTGAKNQPHYRVVAADSRSKRDGKIIEIIGHYDPNVKPPVFKVNQKRVSYWLEKGAQPTETVRKLLQQNGKTN